MMKTLVSSANEGIYDPMIFTIYLYKVETKDDQVSIESCGTPTLMYLGHIFMEKDLFKTGHNDDESSFIGPDKPNILA